MAAEKTADIPLWSRMPYDTNESWVAFQSYRDQTPPRRQRSTTQGTISQVACWAREHFWAARCEAYDRHMDLVVVAEREALLRQGVQDITAQHMVILADARALAQREFAEFMGRSPGGWRPAELVKLLETVIKYDRLVRGEHTEMVASVDLSSFTDEELEVYNELNQKAADGETMQ